MKTFRKNAICTIAVAALLLSTSGIQTFAETQTESITPSESVTETADVGEYTNVITFTDAAVTSGNETGVDISGTELTINEAGTYKITGSCSDGSIKIKKGTAGVTIVLSDLTLTASKTAPFVVGKDIDGVVVIIEGTTILTDAEDPANETSADEDVADAFEGAAIKVKTGSKLTIKGTGTLTLNAAACKNGIKGGTEAEVVIGESASDSFTLNISAKNNALASDGSVIVNGGNINLTAESDGLKSSPDEDDTTSAGTVTVNGGTITINSGEDAIQGDNAVAINGGRLTISAGDDAIHSEYTTNIGIKGSTSGPEIDITGSVEGIEGAVVNLFSGSANVVSSDDGVNAANGDLENYSFAINIYGGKWYINAGGDGLDSNGDINVYGGYTEVFGSSQEDNAALDYGDNNNKFVFSGGTVIGVGMSRMATTPTEGTYVAFGQSGGMSGGMPGGGQSGEMPGGEQPGGGIPGGGQPGEMPGSQTGTAISVTAGTEIMIKDSSGNILYSAVAPKSANHIVFASDTLVSGETYTLYLNGTEAATAAAGEGSQQQTPQPPQQRAESVTLLSMPTRSIYDVNDVFDPTGAKLTVRYSDGRSETVEVTSEMVGAVDMASAGTKTVTVTYEGISVSFVITVYDKTDKSVLNVGSGEKYATVYDAVAAINAAKKSGTAETAYTIRLSGNITETKSVTLPDIPITITADTPVKLVIKGTSLTSKNDLTLENITVTSAKGTAAAITAKKTLTVRNCTLGKITVTGAASLDNCNVGAVTAKGDITINGGELAALTASGKSGAAAARLNGKVTITGNLTVNDLVIGDGAELYVGGKFTPKGSIQAGSIGSFTVNNGK